MAFKVGDRVRIVAGVACPSGRPSEIGKLAVVATGLVPFFRPGDTALQAGTPVHVITLDDGGQRSSPPAWIEPFWDGKEAGEWDELTLRVCKPEKVGA